MSKTKNELQVKKALKYAKSLVDIPYIWWKDDESNPTDIFYADTFPSKTILKKRGINCAGLINLMRQSIGKEIIHAPGKYCIGKYRGGTGYWYNILRKAKKLKPFDYNTDYPIGTLFLRRYKNIKDQGHVAVLYKKNKKYPKHLLYSEIIHSFYQNKDFNGVKITSLGKSHFFLPEGYYEFAILPQHWLLN